MATKNGQDSEFRSNSDEREDKEQHPQKSGGIFGKILGSLFRILSLIVIVCLMTIGSLGLALSVTWQGRFLAASTISFAAITYFAIGYRNKDWFKNIQRRFYLSLSSVCILGILFALFMAPSGGSADSNIRNCYLGGGNKYSRFAPWNIVPEEDQVSVALSVSALVNRKHINQAKAARIRSLTIPIYENIRTQDGFKSLGSAMGSAYFDLIKMSPENGHYFLFLPESRPDEKVPCIVYLHGMGGNRKSHFWAMTEIAKRLKCVVVAPTFGLGNWDETGGADLAVAVTKEAIETLPIDPARIILMGHSNGAKGVTRSVLHAPDLYHGLIYVSPVTEDELFTSSSFIKNLSQRKTLILHGDNDSRIPPEFPTNTTKLIQSLGGNVKLRMYPSEDHQLILSQLDSIADEIVAFIKGDE